jgi:hypothetical protein
VPVEIYRIILQINSGTSKFGTIILDPDLNTYYKSRSYETVVVFEYALKTDLSLCVKYIHEIYTMRCLHKVYGVKKFTFSMSDVCIFQLLNIFHLNPLAYTALVVGQFKYCFLNDKNKALLYTIFKSNFTLFSKQLIVQAIGTWHKNVPIESKVLL